MKLALPGIKLVVTDSLRWRTWWWWAENLTPCVSSPTSSLSITTCASLSEPSYQVWNLFPVQKLPEVLHCPLLDWIWLYFSLWWRGEVKDEEEHLCDLFSVNMPHVLWLCFYQERPRKPIYFLFCVTGSDISVQGKLTEVLMRRCIFTKGK